ncbi:MAG: hypothetical protein D6723_01955 [Acidobacteria bacterium]|nr:MAG: hypothetical protein D6723_01955 [Acidobacteriota bacterium]
MTKRYHRVTSLSLLLLIAALSPVSSPAQREQKKPQRPAAAAKVQQKEAPPITPGPDWQRKVFKVKYADVGQLVNVLKIFGGRLVPNRQLKVIAAFAPPETIAAIAAAIKQLDVPPTVATNVETTAYLLVASERELPLQAIPTELRPVIDQLKKIFAYRGFSLLDTLVVRTRDGTRGNASGVIPSPLAGFNTYYSLSLHPRITSDEKGRVIRIDDLQLNVRLPTISDSTQREEKGAQGSAVEYQNAGIFTSIDVREGQKVVVGKPTLISTSDGTKGALIIVITARVVQ